ncbi:unnamed protein product (macronuclear) [Paramecium tetraurelia]|uniref:Uncharacterized protein n=1 Tax=Paramecium tetraurelia TaxID=5888 RepID=A0CY67_PARTE|nr:uncharacterized protein GSPATT00039072001 [Paramecium tetraurelia]CAK75734.1 unnamed protein product [Paramecium tetraurelia]|eukprot:XP_001443131.1 hypothetical protein (macronuclear) [Paramecium tetraurelia strain d4-2]
MNNLNLFECRIQKEAKTSDSQMGLVPWQTTRDPSSTQQQESLSFDQDDLDILQHVLQHRSQIDYLEVYYQEINLTQIHLITQDWSQEKGHVTKKRNRKRSVESSQVREMFRELDEHKQKQQQKQQPQIQLIIEEQVLSVQELVKSQEFLRKQRNWQVDLSVTTTVYPSRADVRKNSTKWVGQKKS